MRHDAAPIQAELHLPTTFLRQDLTFFGTVLGLRLDMIYPTDNPQVAVYSGHGIRLRPDREWQGQKFVHNVGARSGFGPARLPGFVARDTTINLNTRGVAGVMVLRRGKGDPIWTRHKADIHFSFVMAGSMRLEGEGKDPCGLEPGDAFVIPPGMATRYSEPSDDIELLEVTLPGSFATTRD